jgi:transcriptional regulator with XRE-family HTH domain
MRNAKRELNTDDVVERIESKMKEKSISQRKMIHDLGLSPTSFTRWKYEGGKSYLKYMEQIADYLDVSTDYLLHGEEKISISDLSPQEITLVKNFRSISEDHRTDILEIAKALTYLDQSTKVLS